tara:strand:+ start:53 stop:577 length:525 start_codon:yes stop_codon:yes gene_type:complete
MSNLVPSWIVLSLISLIDIQSESAENIITTVLGFILTLLLIQLSGMVFSVIGKKFFDKIEDRFLFKIPIFNTIYKTIKQIVDTVSNPDKNSFKKVVMVEFPRKGVWTIGFVTGESVDKNNNEYYHIIVPTTPNPTSAYLLFVLKDDVKGTDLTIDEGIKTIISGGVLSSKKNYI